MLLTLLIAVGTHAEEFNNPCPVVDIEEPCTIQDVVIQTTQSISFYSASQITFTNVTLVCYSGLLSAAPCNVTFQSGDITLSSSVLYASYFELNATSISLDDTTLSANGTAPYLYSQVCLDKGGSYGGRGGGSCRATCDVIYGSPFLPTDFGSPGQGNIGCGGGKIIISALSLSLNGGEISAAGNVPLNSVFFGTEGLNITANIGGGSGGSVLILTESYSMLDPVLITVAGGTGGSFSYGGGGGRVAVYGSGPLLRVITSGGVSIDPTRMCVLGGAGTLYVDAIGTLVVDNNGVRTNNITPLPTNSTAKLQVLNGAQAAPWTCETTLDYASISISNALIVQAIDKSNGALPDFLNISAPIIHLTNSASIGTFSETWIQITTQNLTIDTTSGLFFGGLVNISAYYVVLNGEIVGNVQTPILTIVMIYSQFVDILSEGIITSDMIGIVSWNGSVYLQGDIEGPGSTCSSLSEFQTNPVYHCLDPRDSSLLYPDLSALIPSNFTIFILATASLQVMDSGKILGSRIALCSLEITLQGTVSSTGFGCMSGTGVGKGGYLAGECLGSGGGYGGTGGTGMFLNGTICSANPGGQSYGLENETWFEGSGGGSSESIAGAGGGFISVTGVSSISIIQGKLMANGEDSPPSSESEGAGGGAGGSIWLTTQYLIGHLARIWAIGGAGAGLGGGGGGGRVLIEWIGQMGPNSTSNYNQKNCSEGWLQSNVSVSGGITHMQLFPQQNGNAGSFVSQHCIPGHFGPFCLPCGLGDYKEGWDYAPVCTRCSNKPSAATYTHTAWQTQDCPYRCPDTYADASENSHCYSPLEIFIGYFGGPGGAIGVFLGAVGTLTALGFLAHAYTVRFVLKRVVPKPQKPILRGSISTIPSYGRKKMSEESPELTREDLPFHHKRFYLLGDNSYQCPWALPLVPCSVIEEDVILEEFINFADRINSLVRWHFWEHVVLVVLTVLHHPAAQFWLSWRRKCKYKLLTTFIHDYDEVLWKRVDLRELGNCLKASTSHCFTVASLDIMNPSKKIEEWDERPELPLSILCNGDGSFFCPYKLDNADLMVQFLTYSLDVEHLERYYQFIDEFNTLTRTYDFHREYPDTSNPQISRLTSLVNRYNQLLFNERGFEVVPCLFQSLSTVHLGRYIFTSFNYSFSNDIFNVTSKRLNYQDTSRRYCYKPGLVVTSFATRDKTHEGENEEGRVNDAMHWQPLAIDVTSETILSNNNLSPASLPINRLKPSCSFNHFFASFPSGNQCVVLTGLLVVMFTDLLASVVTIIGFASERYWGGIVVFLLVVPLTTFLGQVVGWVMLFRPSVIRIYISFELASLINVGATLVYCLSVEDYFVWSLFLVLDFLCKLAVVRLASMHLAHAETYTLPTASPGIGAELIESDGYTSSRTLSLDI